MKPAGFFSSNDVIPTPRTNEMKSTPRTNLKLTQDIISENVPEILIDDSMSDFVSPKFAPEWTLSG